jgi:1-deoxy-D-xylulose-5-phosphate synthase
MATHIAEALSRLDRSEDIAHWDLRFVKPIDPELLQFALAQPFVLVVEDGCTRGCAGSAIGLALIEAGYKGTFQVTALPDAFVTQGTPDELYALFRLDSNGIQGSLLALISIR